MSDVSRKREEFADFLKRVAAGSVGAGEWSQFVAGHYSDELIENIRRQVAKLSIDREGGKEWSDSELAALRHWSRSLRSTDKP